MIYFNSDYTETAHPAVLERIAATTGEQLPGYGEDAYCGMARDRIRDLCESPGADVHFLTGGTQTNLTAISAALRPHQGVLCCVDAHISTHESGAVEAVGHKVLGLESPDGKISAQQVDRACGLHYHDPSREHIVQPGMVFLSLSTELGTTYTRKELAEIRAACDEWGLYLYVDGARLGYGMMAQGCDLDLPAIAALCDFFYIGGTKQGALMGEALVIRNDALKKDFRYIIKQKGGMLAKGWLLGVQFLALLEGNLYFDLAGHADECALLIRKSCAKSNIPLLYDAYTNQQFVVMESAMLKKLEERFVLTPWGKRDETHEIVRICTSWATRKEDVEQLCRAIEGYAQPR